MAAEKGSVPVVDYKQLNSLSSVVLYDTSAKRVKRGNIVRGNALSVAEHFSNSDLISLTLTAFSSLSKRSERDPILYYNLGQQSRCRSSRRKIFSVSREIIRRLW